MTNKEQPPTPTGDPMRRGRNVRREQWSLYTHNGRIPATKQKQTMHNDKDLSAFKYDLDHIRNIRGRHTTQYMCTQVLAWECEPTEYHTRPPVQRNKILTATRKQAHLSPRV
jgi:hypothetical protein